MIINETVFIELIADNGKILVNGDIKATKITLPLGSDYSSWIEREETDNTNFILSLSNLGIAEETVNNILNEITNLSERDRLRLLFGITPQ